MSFIWKTQNLSLVLEEFGIFWAENFIITRKLQLMFLSNKIVLCSYDFKVDISTTPVLLLILSAFTPLISLSRHQSKNTGVL